MFINNRFLNNLSEDDKNRKKISFIYTCFQIVKIK